MRGQNNNCRERGEEKTQKLEGQRAQEVKRFLELGQSETSFSAIHMDHKTDPKQMCKNLLMCL